MYIEGRCPRGELTRTGIIVLMMLGFSGYFFYDGLIGYPEKNLRWAIDNLPPGWPNVTDQHQWPEINAKVTEESVALLSEGMKLDEVGDLLGEPGLIHGSERRYFGPAGFLIVETLGTLVKSIKYNPSPKPSAGDIWLQKVFGVIFLCIGLYFLYRWVRMITMRTILTDEGLSLNGKRPIAWDEMIELDDCEYQRKAWVYLKHNHGGSATRIKLDSYRIHTFREMIGELCARKGFPVPFIKKDAPDSQDGSEGPADKSDAK